VTGPGHPERPERLYAIEQALTASGLLDRCTRLALREATDCDIERVHRAPYIERVAQACQRGAAYIDTPDSSICGESYALARRAAGSVLEAVDQVMGGAVQNAFCPVRPPGHHAMSDHSMGFCLFNNIAIAADHLIHHHGLRRVLILDWDVHHGNGTQATFEHRRDVLFVSLHGHPSWVYPGTSGWENETGHGDGEGYTLNVAMEPGVGDAAYREAFNNRVEPLVASYRPEFVLISAGFDAHAADPLAPIELEDDSYAWMTRSLMDTAARYAKGRLVSVLEGGYDLGALARCVALHVAHLLDYGAHDTAAD
jgi:acetoin utilization deacetylase AcuC-like enzyme